MPVPPSRICPLTDVAARAGGRYVLYWMIAHRRLRWNFALDRAVELANTYRTPLLILEPLRVGYTHASARFHRFVIDGMRDNDAAVRATDLRPADVQVRDRQPYAQGRGVAYFPYVESSAGAGKGLLATLAEQAAAVVTDDAAHAHYPAMLDAAARQIGTRLEAIDGHGLIPARGTERTFHRAYDFRRYLHENLPFDVEARPQEHPLGTLSAQESPTVPPAVLRRWAPADPALLKGDDAGLRALPIDHTVTPVALRGGPTAGSRRVDGFVEHKLSSYARLQKHPDEDASSGLSPYLHFGHVGTHQIFAAICSRYEWSPTDVDPARRGKQAGWWSLPEGPEAFLDQLLTWRELGFNACVTRPDVSSFRSLPDWARKTMRMHESDARSYLYTTEQLEAGDTHDEVWNAAQRQLLLDGVVHSYLRMLWGKLIYAWSPNGRRALATMLHLNDKYALDGRDPNSLSGILWVLGRYDRAWGPERPVFGKLRPMTSANALRKLRMRQYLERYT